MRERIANRQLLNAPERQCLCGHPYRYAWSWALILPARKLIDLCSHCTRALRYGDEDERREIAERLESSNREWRLAV
jgi:hypothetical protein